MLFNDRNDAGIQLSRKLHEYKNRSDVIVLGLPRGGVVVAYEVAKKLNLPLDIVVARKIGAPGNSELAIGAITADGKMYLNAALIESMYIAKDYIKSEAAKEKKEALRRFNTYRGNRSALNLKNKTVILVDDGIATGATMMAAIASVKASNAKEIIVAIPVLPFESVKTFKKLCDELIYVDAPEFYSSVGEFYHFFGQTEDEEVIALMESR